MELFNLPADVLRYLLGPTPDFFGPELGLVLVRLNLSSKLWKNHAYKFISTLNIGAHFSDLVDPRQLPAVRTLILNGHSYACRSIPLQTSRAWSMLYTTQHVQSARFRILTTHGGLLNLVDLRIYGIHIKAGALSRLHHLRSLASVEIVSKGVNTNAYKHLAKLTQLQFLLLAATVGEQYPPLKKLYTLTNLKALSVPAADEASANEILKALPKLETLHIARFYSTEEGVDFLKFSPRLLNCLVGVPWQGMIQTMLGHIFASLSGLLTLDYIKTLIKKGIDIHGSPGALAGRVFVVPPIFAAWVTIPKSVSYIASLLEAGADPSGRLPGALRPAASLHHRPECFLDSAIQTHEKVQAIQLLLQKGFNPALVPLRGLPPVHALAELGRGDVLKALLAHSPDLPLNSVFNQSTPLGIARFLDSSNPAAATALLEANANPWQRIATRDHLMRHPFSARGRGCGRGTGWTCVRSRRMRRGLLPPDPNDPYSEVLELEVMTPVHFQASSGVPEVFEYLLEHDMRIPADAMLLSEPSKFNLLHCAALPSMGVWTNTFTAALDFLVWNYKDEPSKVAEMINGFTASKLTPLQMVINNCETSDHRLMLLTRLHSLGGSINERGSDHSPLYLALLLRDFESAWYLIEQGAKVESAEWVETDELSPLGLVADLGEQVPAKIVDHFLEVEAAGINTLMTKHNLTAIQTAIMADSNPIFLTKLIQHGADLSIPNINGDTGTSLYIQLHDSTEDTLRMLLETHPESINFCNVNGSTLLHHVLLRPDSYRDHPGTPPILPILHHPNFNRTKFINQVSVFGSPLVLALRRLSNEFSPENLEIFDAVLAAGADINQVMDFGPPKAERDAILAAAPPLAARIGYVLNNRTIAVPVDPIDLSNPLRWDTCRAALRNGWESDPIRTLAFRGVTALFMTDCSSPKLTRALKQRGCNFEHKNDNEQTALAHAVLLRDYTGVHSLRAGGDASWTTTIDSLKPIAGPQAGTRVPLSLTEFAFRILLKETGNNRRSALNCLLALFHGLTKDEIWGELKNSTTISHFITPYSTDLARFNGSPAGKLAKSPYLLPPISLAHWSIISTALTGTLANGQPDRGWDEAADASDLPMHYLGSTLDIVSAFIAALLDTTIPADEFTDFLLKNLKMNPVERRTPVEMELVPLLIEQLHLTEDQINALPAVNADWDAW